MNIKIPIWRTHTFPCPECSTGTVTRCHLGVCDDCYKRAWRAFRVAVGWPWTSEWAGDGKKYPHHRK